MINFHYHVQMMYGIMINIHCHVQIAFCMQLKISTSFDLQHR